MVDVTTLAQEKLNEYMLQNNISSPLRVMLMEGGCSGPALGLALDEEKKSDDVTTLDELTFLIEKNLLSECGEVSIDFVDAGSQSGFSITSSNPLPGAGSGCHSGSCGSGGCGC
ncbi:IscA/HesB family protein [Desulfopila inferna]|uniref:IscA/HesB family protein n=1 Tax=Desulfopila inferna TaxID=468528 RepID=UPI001965E61E|nr:IscA/HesB family protein [Desulfopila inferna]MBM9604966.1 IscA/HesB family protein [Desulfopila inferna]